MKTKAARLTAAVGALGVAWWACSLTIAAESPTTAPAPATETPKPTAPGAVKSPEAKPEVPKPAGDAGAKADAKSAAGTKTDAAVKSPSDLDEAAKAAQAVADGDEEKLPPPPTTAADKKGSPQRFTPSEQVRADFDVSFPIDI